MGRHMEHIRAIVHVQQTYAQTPCSPRSATLAQLIDDALRIQFAALERHGVSITRELASLPRVHGGQAQGAADPHQPHRQRQERAWTRCPRASGTCTCGSSREHGWARIQVVDNGMGIAPELRGKLFTHGFTTRKDGHGFGLHSSALAAQMLGGR